MNRLVIDDCMSPGPYTIRRDQTMADAHRLMRENRIRHLPVLGSDGLVGLLSVRDLHIMETLKDVDPEQVAVGDAMSEDPYAVQVGTPLREVAITMNARKFGSAVVLDGTRVVGVFTTVDAMRVLANVL